MYAAWIIDLEDPVRRGTACMHDTLRNAFMIEMGDFFPKMKSSISAGPRSRP